MDKLFVVIRFSVTYLVLAAAAFGQSITLTSPGSGTISGIVTLSSSLISAPSTATVEYVLDDFYPLALVRDGSINPTYKTTTNTGFLGDGPNWIKAVARDALGTVLATSAQVPVTVNNFGFTTSWTSPTVNAPTINLSGTVTLACTDSLGAAEHNLQISIDGNMLWASTSPLSRSFDTKRLPNGNHIFNCIADSSVSGTTVVRTHTAFVGNVQNGSALMAVKADITDLRMVAGGPACSAQTGTSTGCGTYQLAPVLINTDGSTSARTFNYTVTNPCQIMDAAAPPQLFPCSQDNSSQATLNGANAVSVSGTGLITALQRGQSIITITDTGSGKTALVQVIVQTYANVVHLTKDGRIVHSFDSSANGSFFRISMFNTGLAPANEIGFGRETFASHYRRVKATAFESQAFRQPHGYASFGAWQTDWLATEFSQLQALFAALPGMSLVMRGDDGLQFGCGGALNSVAQGPSASWGGDELMYTILHTKAAGNIAGLETTDEADQGCADFNPVYTSQMSDGSINRIVSDGAGHCTVFSGTGLAQGKGFWYSAGSRWGVPVTVSGATTAGLNGSNAITKKYCTLWNLYWNAGVCPSGGTTPIDGYEMACSAAAGTYNSGSDPDLVINLRGDSTTYTNLPGDPAQANDIFSKVNARIASTGIPYAYPVLGAADPVTHQTWEGPSMANYESIFRANSEAFNIVRYFPWGQSYDWGRQERQNTLFGQLAQPFGSAFPDASGAYWKRDGNGYVFRQPDVPWVQILGVQVFDFNRGGRPLTVAKMDGSVLTTTTPHGLGLFGISPINNHLVTFSGTGDSLSTDNSGHWDAGNVISPTEVEIFRSRTGDIPGCTLANQPTTVTIRGLTYNVVSPSGPGSAWGVSTPLPPDLTPGEHVTVSGNVPACNVTIAFYSYTSTTGFYTMPFANSTTTTGTAIVNDSEGAPNPLTDLIINMARPNLFQPDGMYGAASGLAGYREYQYQNVTNDNGSWPNNGVDLQTTPLPYYNSPTLVQRQAWWALSQMNSLITRLAPFYLQTYQPSPNYGVFLSADPFSPAGVQSAVMASTNGKALTVVNFSESPNTVSIDLTKYQTGSNPISVYRLWWPALQTDLLTGVQGTVSETLPPGGVTVFVAHSGPSSYVQAVPYRFNFPPNATKAALRYGYGYAGPLAEYRAGVLCSASPCIVNLDPSLNDIYYQIDYLDDNNVRVSGGDIQRIAAQR